MIFRGALRLLELPSCRSCCGWSKDPAIYLKPLGHFGPFKVLPAIIDRLNRRTSKGCTFLTEIKLPSSEADAFKAFLKAYEPCKGGFVSAITLRNNARSSASASAQSAFNYFKSIPGRTEVYDMFQKHCICEIYLIYFVLKCKYFLLLPSLCCSQGKLVINIY